MLGITSALQYKLYTFTELLSSSSKNKLYIRQTVYTTQLNGTVFPFLLLVERSLLLDPIQLHSYYYITTGVIMRYFERTDYVHRTYCDVLQEMRDIVKHMDEFNIVQSRSILKSLVEELQVYGNRMETALSYKGDLEKLHDKRKRLITYVEGLEAIAPDFKKEEE